MIWCEPYWLLISAGVVSFCSFLMFAWENPWSQARQMRTRLAHLEQLMCFLWSLIEKFQGGSTCNFSLHLTRSEEFAEQPTLSFPSQVGVYKSCVISGFTVPVNQAPPPTFADEGRTSGDKKAQVCRTCWSPGILPQRNIWQQHLGRTQ